MVSFAQSNSGNDTPLSAVPEGNVDVVTLNETTNYDNQVKIHPTITEDIINYATADDYKFTIAVFDIYGKKQNVEIHKGTINLNDLTSGIYIIQFTCKKFIVTKNVVKK